MQPLGRLTDHRPADIDLRRDQRDLMQIAEQSQTARSRLRQQIAGIDSPDPSSRCITKT